MSRVTTFALASVLACAFAPPLQAQNAQQSVQIPIKSYGQELVDRTAAQNPGLLVMAMYATPPGGKDTVIIASNIGRFGKPADEQDLRLIQTAKTGLEPGGGRLRLKLALRSMDGDNIGLLALAFPYKEGDSQEALEKMAIRIRDDLAGRILNTRNLVEPFPLDPGATSKTHAQKLVDQTLAKHPEVTLLAIHVTPPNAHENIAIASNFGRHGKKGDEEGTQVMSSGQPFVDVRKRFRGVLPLRDAAGQTVGTLTVGMPIRPGQDKNTLLPQAEKVRDELAAQTPSLKSLLELDP